MALILVAGGSIAWWRVMDMARAGRNAQPILDKGQLRALLTYKRHCRKQADCENPLLCMSDARASEWRCLASECQTDLQCQPGFMCTPFSYTGFPPIRLCLIQGTQK